MLTPPPIVKLLARQTATGRRAKKPMAKLHKKQRYSLINYCFWIQKKDVCILKNYFQKLEGQGIGLKALTI